jgi:predicted transposase YdaD
MKREDKEMYVSVFEEVYKEEGLKEGLKKGREEATKEIAKNLLANGTPPRHNSRQCRPVIGGNTLPHELTAT